MSPRPPLLQRPPVIKRSPVYKPGTGRQLTRLLLNVSWRLSGLCLRYCRWRLSYAYVPGPEHCDYSHERAALAPTEKANSPWQLSVLCAVASWFWCRWLPSQLVSLWPREEGCTRKRRELRSRSLAVGPPLMCYLYLSTSSSSSFDINELSSCQAPHIAFSMLLKAVISQKELYS